MNLFQYHTNPEQLVGYADRMQLVPELALEAAKKGNSSPEVLSIIAASPLLSYLYAMDVIKKPWPPGETAIAQSSERRKDYNQFLKDNRAGYQI